MICLVIKIKSENCSNCSNISCNMYSNLTEHDWTLATGYLDTQHNIHYSQPTIIFPKINPYLFVKHARYIPLFIFLPVTLPWGWQKAANINFLFFHWKHIIRKTKGSQMLIPLNRQFLNINSECCWKINITMHNTEKHIK